MKLTKEEKRAIIKLLILSSLEEYSITRFDTPEVRFNISGESRVVIKDINVTEYLDLKFDTEKIIKVILDAKWYVEKTTITLEEIE